MSSWSTKHQFTYAGILILVILLIVAAGSAKVIYKPATCFDGKQNGDETGVDCGGGCIKICLADAIEPQVLWQRFSQVGPGIYNALAYVENVNPTAGVYSISYHFKFYDSDQVVIAERSGTTFLPPNKISPIFEGAISTGARVPVRSSFEFTETPLWRKDFKSGPELIVTKKVFSEDNSLPRIDATVLNNSVQTIAQADVIAIAYDAAGNAMAFGKTLVEDIKKNESKDIVFTWREPFPSTVSKIEVIPRTIPSALQ